MSSRDKRDCLREDNLIVILKTDYIEFKYYADVIHSAIPAGLKIKPGYIEFGVVVYSETVVCIHSAILQLLLTRRVSYC